MYIYTVYTDNEYCNDKWLFTKEKDAIDFVNSVSEQDDDTEFQIGTMWVNTSMKEVLRYYDK